MNDNNLAVSYFVHGDRLTDAVSDPQIHYFSDASSALESIEQSSADIVILVSHRLFAEVAAQPFDPIISNCDLLHAGHGLNTKDSWSIVSSTVWNWWFIDADLSRASTNWKASAEICAIRPKMVRALGGFDSAYRSADGKLADLAFRALFAGARVSTSPQWTNMQFRSVDSYVPLADRFVFLHRNLGRLNARSAFLYRLFTSLFWRMPKIINEYLISLHQIARYPVPTHGSNNPDEFKLMTGTAKRIGKISAIIPTLNRYNYIEKAIDSLMTQDPAPAEIIVVDQTPLEKRNLSIYSKYDPEIVKVFILKRAGQSLARNFGIKKAKNRWIYLFDDDSVAWEGMLLEHINTVELSGAEISTGLSLAPWKDKGHIPAKNRHNRLVDVLDTGNCFASKSALESVGGLDCAFDKGTGADNDLGTRLYLSGKEIVLAPGAIRTHYKATTGGLRTHGAWWRYKTSLFSPFPPPTSLFSIKRFVPKEYWMSQYLGMLFNGLKRNKGLDRLMLILLLPWKVFRAINMARKLYPNANLNSFDYDELVEWSNAPDYRMASSSCEMNGNLST